MYVWPCICIFPPISAFSSLQFLASLFLSVSACSLLIPPPPPSMQCEGTFVSEAWRLCSGAVHLQLDEHLTPESFYTELPHALHRHTYGLKRKHSNASTETQLHTAPFFVPPSPYSLVWECVHVSVRVRLCDDIQRLQFRLFLPSSLSLSLVFSLSFTLSVSYPASYFRFFSQDCAVFFSC